MFDRINQSVRGALEDALEHMLCVVRGGRHTPARVALTRIVIIRPQSSEVYASAVARHRHADAYRQR